MNLPLWPLLAVEGPQTCIKGSEYIPLTVLAIEGPDMNRLVNLPIDPCKP